MHGTTLVSVANMETVIFTKEVKEKLSKGGIMSGHIDEFCRVFAIRLPEEITPLGYLMAFELLVSDMERAKGHEITGIGAPIQSYLAGLPIGAVVRMLRTKIANHCLPEAFAKEVADEWKGVLEDIENDRETWPPSP